MEFKEWMSINVNAVEMLDLLFEDESTRKDKMQEFRDNFIEDRTLAEKEAEDELADNNFHYHQDRGPC